MQPQFLWCKRNRRHGSLIKPLLSLGTSLEQDPLNRSNIHMQPTGKKPQEKTSMTRWFQRFYFHPYPFWNDPIWRSYQFFKRVVMKHQLAKYIWSSQTRDMIGQVIPCGRTNISPYQGANLSPWFSFSPGGICDRSLEGNYQHWN